MNLHTIIMKLLVFVTLMTAFGAAIKLAAAPSPGCNINRVFHVGSDHETRFLPMFPPLPCFLFVRTTPEKRCEKRQQYTTLDCLH